MPRIIFVLSTGESRDVEVVAGRSVMRAANDANLPGIDAVCGGQCSCATCHVYVDETWLSRLPERSELEEEMLETVSAEFRPTSRLSCQISVTPELDGLRVQMPDIQ